MQLIIYDLVQLFHRFKDPKVREQKSAYQNFYEQIYLSYQYFIAKYFVLMNRTHPMSQRLPKNMQMILCLLHPDHQMLLRDMKRLKRKLSLKFRQSKSVGSLSDLTENISIENNDNEIRNSERK